MNTTTRTARTISESRHYVTLTGKINQSSDNGGIGPSIMTIAITQTTDEATGQEFAPSYSISFDGHYQCGGFAAHLPSDPATASFIRSMAIVHGEIVAAPAPAPAPTPMTYAAAAKVAETISLDEFKTLLAADHNSVTIFPKPRARRRHCWNVRINGEGLTVTRYLWVSGECCAPVCGTNDYLTANFRLAIFDFYASGRIVQVDVSEELPVVASEEVVAAQPENVLAILDEAIESEKITEVPDLITVATVGEHDHRENIIHALRSLLTYIEVFDDSVNGDTKYIITSFSPGAGHYEAAACWPEYNVGPIVYRLMSYDGSGSFSEDFAVVGDELCSSENEFKPYRRNQ